MRVLGKTFIDNYINKILNLHPALPGKYPGVDAISRAYSDFQEGKIQTTGAMVHIVVEEVDAGEVVDFVEVPIHKSDSLSDLEARVRAVEKPLFVNAINKYLNTVDILNSNPSNLLNHYVGKVRDRFEIGYNLVCFHLSDRMSSFDRHICDVRGKGNILNLMNKWWLERTRHIIPNH